MKRNLNKDHALALGCAVLALVIALAWVPLDTDSGILETVRRRVSIGDSAAPTLAAGFVLLGALLLALEARRGAHEITIEPRNLGFLAVLLAVIAVALVAMRFAGPLTAGLLSDTDYRFLRIEAPWKYLGFLLGGVTLVAGLIALVEGRITLRALAVGLAATLVLIAAYDLSFDNLMLPPNGDF